MLVVLIGPACSGRSSIAEYLVDLEGFTRVAIASNSEEARVNKSEKRGKVLSFDSAARFLDFATLNWRQHFVTTHDLAREDVQSFRKRPWVLLVGVEAPLLWRYGRHTERYIRCYLCSELNTDRANRRQQDPQTLLDFIQEDDYRIHGSSLLAATSPNTTRHLQLPSGPISLPKATPTPPGTPLMKTKALPEKVPTAKGGNEQGDERLPLCDILPLANLTIRPATFETLDLLHDHLRSINFTDEQRVRPSWDDYFMTLAELASLRSNCMKRRVGAVLISSTRKVVISTGYNGTPRGMLNCAQGGCERCNSASKRPFPTNGGNTASTDGPDQAPVRSGMEMEECLCLHAEENALLEAGRERAGAGEGGTLYCNTCPCLRCTVKIVQCGVREVVYSKSYSMDANSARVFSQAGVQLRQIALKSH